MRPQHNAAENVGLTDDYEKLWLASMRPQHNAAENSPVFARDSRNGRGFNEAAA